MVTKTDLLANTENKAGDNVRVDKEIVCRENQSEYRYINNAKQRVAKIRVDGGLILDKNRQKCDWLLVDCDSARSFFIELKGSNVNKALEQISTSLDLLWSDINKLGICVAHARIVTSKTPTPKKMDKNKQYRLEQRLKKDCGGGKLKIQTKQLIETF